MTGSSRKDSAQLIKQARKQGFECKLSKSNHWHIMVKGIRILTIANTPSDVRSTKNSIAALRKHGFVWPPRR